MVIATHSMKQWQISSAIPLGVLLTRLKAAKAAGLLQREQKLLQIAAAA